MSLGQTLQRELLDHLILNTAIPDIGDTTGLPAAAAAGTVTIRLHTADPGEAGAPTTNEASYTGYSAQTASRGSGNWTRTADTIDNDNEIAFGQNTGTSETITHVSVSNSVGTLKILWSGALSASLEVTNGVDPNFPPGELNITLD